MSRVVWTVTTTGDLPDDHEERVHDASAAAWLDYNGRILEYEIARCPTRRRRARVRCGTLPLPPAMGSCLIVILPDALTRPTPTAVI